MSRIKPHILSEIRAIYEADQHLYSGKRVPLFKQLGTKYGYRWETIRGFIRPDNWARDPGPKRCTLCGIIKQPNAYHLNNQLPDGRQNMCIACRNGIQPVKKAPLKRACSIKCQYRCPICGMGVRGGNRIESGHGEPFTSQAEANMCCDTRGL